MWRQQRHPAHQVLASLSSANSGSKSPFDALNTFEKRSFMEIVSHTPFTLTSATRKPEPDGISRR